MGGILVELTSIKDKRDQFTLTIIVINDRSETTDSDHNGDGISDHKAYFRVKQHNQRESARESFQCEHDVLSNDKYKKRMQKKEKEEKEGKTERKKRTRRKKLTTDDGSGISSIFYSALLLFVGNERTSERTHIQRRRGKVEYSLLGFSVPHLLPLVYLLYMCVCVCALSLSLDVRNYITTQVRRVYVLAWIASEACGGI